MRRIFITGTDTNCGKTYVTCQLITYFKENNKKVLGIKPVVSGGIEQDGELVYHDLIHLQNCNDNATYPIAGWKMSEPIAPHLAAKKEKMRLLAKEITTFCCHPVYNNFDFLFIEGAGGVLVPLNENETWLDFLGLAKIPVIITVGLRLGCINHALLTAWVLESYQIACIGWIANCLDKDMLALEENINTLKQRMPIPLIGRVPYAGKIITQVSYYINDPLVPQNGKLGKL